MVLYLLKICGAVKSWKRPQDVASGTPKGFGFCEFESAEGVLRALRLLSKFKIDWQELTVCLVISLFSSSSYYYFSFNSFSLFCYCSSDLVFVK